MHIPVDAIKGLFFEATYLINSGSDACMDANLNELTPNLLRKFTS